MHINLRKILLPKLHDSAGEIGGVYYAVVCITSVCVPWIVTSFPWKLLQKAQECFIILYNYLFKKYPKNNYLNKSPNDFFYGMQVHVTRNAYSGKGVVQVVQGPGNDDNVVNVQPE